MDISAARQRMITSKMLKIFAQRKYSQEKCEKHFKYSREKCMFAMFLSREKCIEIKLKN